MRITRIQVPHFRVLHDVDLEFDQSLSPQVFPLGSQNGGGKSTLLQLVFVLLHCSSDPEKSWFIENLLAGFSFKAPDVKSQELCLIEIEHDSRIVRFEFLIFSNVNQDEESNLSPHNFMKIDEADELVSRIKDLEFEVSQIEELREEVSKAIQIEDTSEKREFLTHVARTFKEQLKKYKEKYASQLLDLNSPLRRKRSWTDADDILQGIHEHSILLQNQRAQVLSSYILNQDSVDEIFDWLQEHDLEYICSTKTHEELPISLLYRLKGVEELEELGKVEDFLTAVAQKVYLAAPATHVFLFMDDSAKDSMFKAKSSGTGKLNYYLALEQLRKSCSGLFTYDFEIVESLLDVFRKAKDRDFEHAVKFGNYGTEYQLAIQQINTFLGNKTIRINPELSEIFFETNQDGKSVSLFPEDLSHGELKRLSTYLWLRYKVPNNSLVLMDEVEIALHPDWQYQVTTDLVEWKPSNQYILATHSYELCEALTPAHVKELEPKLKQKESTAA